MIEINYTGDDLWQRIDRAVEKVKDRLRRVTRALNSAEIPYAVIGSKSSFHATPLLVWPLSCLAKKPLPPYAPPSSSRLTMCPCDCIWRRRCDTRRGTHHFLRFISRLSEPIGGWHQSSRPNGPTTAIQIDATEITLLLRVSSEKALGWIRRAELTAVDVGNGLRPRYRINREYLIRFFEVDRYSRHRSAGVVSVIHQRQT